MRTWIFALLCAAGGADDWEYRAGIGFVNAATMEKKSPEEFLAYGIALREAGRHDAARDVFSLIAASVPESPAAERGHLERADTGFHAENFYEAYHDYEAFIVKYPQSDRAVHAKRMEMTSALELAKKGHKRGVLGLPILSSSQTGIDYLKDALKRYPREDFSPEFYQKLGMYYYDKRDFDDAEGEFSFVLDQYADSPYFVLALYMLGRTREHRFEALDYDVKPLRDARRHYDRFVEEADRMRKLPGAGREWVDRYVEDVKAHLAKVNELLARKDLETGGYYEWKGYPRAAALSYRAVLKYFPKTAAAGQAAERLSRLAAESENPLPSEAGAELPR